MLESLFNKSLGCNFIKTRLQHRCSPAKFANFLRTSFVNNTSGGCFCNDYYNFISTNLILRIKIDFVMFAARNGKKVQDMSSLGELEKTEQNLRGSYKVIGNCKRKFKA